MTPISLSLSGLVAEAGSRKLVNSAGFFFFSQIMNCRRPGWSFYCLYCVVLSSCLLFLRRLTAILWGVRCLIHVEVLDLVLADISVWHCFCLAGSLHRSGRRNDHSEEQILKQSAVKIWYSLICMIRVEDLHQRHMNVWFLD